MQNRSAHSKGPTPILWFMANPSHHKIPLYICRVVRSCLSRCKVVFKAAERRQCAIFAFWPSSAAERAMSEQTSGAPIVYVVDDDRDVREGLKDLLESVGLMAQVFETAEEFLKSERADKVSCLILDVRLPGM